jgi:hypothetical protein
MRNILMALVLVSCAVPAGAQSVLTPPSRGKTVNLAWPRFGFTSLSQGVVDELHKRDINVGSSIGQFGWQFERQFYARAGGIGALNELVVLVGGLDQGVAHPSVTWMVGPLCPRRGTARELFVRESRQYPGRSLGRT